MRCQAINKNKKKCKRKAELSIFCTMHVNYVLELEKKVEEYNRIKKLIEEYDYK